jgi:hypothetical protein
LTPDKNRHHGSTRGGYGIGDFGRSIESHWERAARSQRISVGSSYVRATYVDFNGGVNVLDSYRKRILDRAGDVFELASGGTLGEKWGSGGGVGGYLSRVECQVRSYDLARDWVW